MMDMRIIVTGDRFWDCHTLAAVILRRLVDRYGPDITSVHGGGTGVDESFASACGVLGIVCESHLADWYQLGKKAGRIRNGKTARAGADMCIALHRFLPACKGTKDCCRQAIEAGIATYLIDSDEGVPRRVKADDPQLV